MPFPASVPTDIISFSGRIAAIDFSQEIVDKMIAENTSSVVYAKMDARKLEYDSSEFDCVIDKG